MVVRISRYLCEEKDYKNIIWNNKEIKRDNKPVYFKNYREAEITYTHDLLFDRDIIVAFTHLSNKINKTNFLQWAGLRHSIPSQLRFANVQLSTPLWASTFTSYLSYKAQDPFSTCRQSHGQNTHSSPLIFRQDQSLLHIPRSSQRE